jgi:hypothetical protein
MGYAGFFLGLFDLMIEAVHPHRILVNLYQAAQPYIPEIGTLHLRAIC